MIFLDGRKGAGVGLSLFRSLFVLMIPVAMSSQALAWTATHHATTVGGSGPVIHHEWIIKPEGATIRDIHICLQSVPDKKVDANGDGTVSRAENANFETDLRNDWKTPSIRHGPGDQVVNWNFSVTRNRSNGKVCLNFYGNSPLPSNEDTRFDLQLEWNSNQFEKGHTAASVTFDKAEAIATSDGDQSTDSPISNGHKPNVGGPILLAAMESDRSFVPWAIALALVILIAVILIATRHRKEPVAEEPGVNEQDEKPKP